MGNDTTCYRSEVDAKLIETAKETLNKKQVSLEEQAKLFSLLGNEVRLKIMTLFLHYERMCVCDLGDVLGMKQSPISQHLRKLKDGGLLSNHHEGMTIFYFIPADKRERFKAVIEG